MRILLLCVWGLLFVACSTGLLKFGHAVLRANGLVEGSFPVLIPVLMACAPVIAFGRIDKTSTVENRGTVWELHQPDVLAALVLFLLVAACGASSFILLSRQQPLGAADAQIIYNYQARVLQHAPFNFLESFDRPVINHPDYPQLLAGIVSSGWQVLGNSAVVPAMVAAFFLVTMIGIVTLSVAELDGLQSGLLAGSLVASPPALYMVAAGQIADVPLSCLSVAVVALCTFGVLHPGRFPHSWVLAGFFWSMLPWMKNEGAVISGALCVPVFAYAGRTPGARRSFLLAALPALAGIVWYRNILAPANDLVLQSTVQVIGHIQDPFRYAYIAKSFVQALWRFEYMVLSPVLIVPFVVLLTRRRSSAKTPAARLRITFWCSIGVVLLVYAGIYLTTPHDLEWHIATSLDRLLLHVWPVAVLLSMSARSTDSQSPYQAGTVAAPLEVSG